MAIAAFTCFAMQLSRGGPGSRTQALTERMPGSCSVAASGSIRFRCCRLVGYDGLLLVLREFFLFVAGIQELIPDFTTGIEPLQERIRLSCSLFG